MIQNATLLLVEDNADDVALMLRALRKHNVANQILVARDGVEALDLLFPAEAKNNAAPQNLPHLVLLDLKLPKVDGLEVLRQIRSHPTTRSIPVVILTTSDEEKDLLAGYDYGANSYVRKPVDFIEFTEAVRQLGIYWFMLNRLPPRGE
ncbi:response regulator [Nitrococcus mobilis]|uniref:Response regulator receiver n=1 Tax=Nitrococcus mobilis Nb-231 TaxID=314278 RepID=A4BQ24_9GAMM|nr:Response regulator receiver [Nitrococcus mobilis Nb-231]